MSYFPPRPSPIPLSLYNRLAGNLTVRQLKVCSCFRQFSNSHLNKPLNHQAYYYSFLEKKKKKSITDFFLLATEKEERIYNPSLSCCVSFCGLVRLTEYYKSIHIHTRSHKQTHTARQLSWQWSVLISVGKQWSWTACLFKTNRASSAIDLLALFEKRSLRGKSQHVKHVEKLRVNQKIRTTYCK